MTLRTIASLVLSVFALTSLSGCGGDDELFAGESESTRAIRLKVRETMERERVERLGRRIAHATASAAASPSATALAVLPAGESAAATTGEPEAGPTGPELYAANCASCHGTQGAGDGLLAAGLDPKPTNHTDGGYMNALSNDHLMKVVKEGGAAVGKSAMMAPWGGTMSDDQIQSVVVFMRSLAVPAYAGDLP